MKTRIQLLLVTAAMLVIAVSPLRAQLVADGATNTLNGGTATIAGDVTVGTNGPFTLLVLTNNALLTNSGFGHIGRNAGANSNAVWLTGTNTRWLMGGDLYVGSNGAFNRLVITNGGAVRNDIGWIGVNSNSSYNLVLVTGAGSIWSNQLYLVVGLYGVGNRLVINNGGRVENHSSVIGGDFGIGNNEVLVTGAGSFWNNRSRIDVGLLGQANRLVISNDGTVVSGGDVNVGFNSGAINNLLLLSSGALLTNTFDGVLGAGVDIGGSSNTAFVSDLNTRWLMGGNLHVGTNGAFNRLVITNGALVRDDYGYLGDSTSSSNNEAVVTGAGSMWSNRFGLHVGNSGSGNRLVIANGGIASDLNGVLALNPESSNSVAVVTDAGSLWMNSSNLYVGYAGSGNQLVVNNSGEVRSIYGYLGYDSISSNNAVVVTGAGSLWTNGMVEVGYLGSGNQLVVSNGGVVRCISSRLGYKGSSNAAVVTGAGSLWTNLGTLYVGDCTAGNQLVVENGGVAWDTTGFIGRYDSSNNAAVVTGADSLWANAQELVVGSGSPGNQLVVSNGGVVRDFTGLLGSGFLGSRSSNNAAVVTGTGSLWANLGELVIGSVSASNKLTISNGGMVRAGGLVILGSRGDNNSLVATGGSLTSVGLTLGGLGSRNNSITLVSGSTWDVGGGTFIWGENGFNNTLAIDATSAMTNIGSLTLGEHDTAFYLTNAPGGYTLNGLKTNQFQFKPTGLGALVVGSAGTNTQLTIRDYTLANTTGTIGYYNSARNNSVLVTGSGSVWSNSAALTIGNLGSLNQLAINNGGLVVSPSGAVGSGSGSDFNLVTVNGPNSLWKNSGPLTTGAAGAFNQLVISDGGRVTDTIGRVGSTGSNNLAFLTGAGSVWSNSSDLFIGEGGSFNQLVVSNSAVVANKVGTVGDTGSNNFALVTGAGSLWKNSSDLILGNSGSFNQIVVSNSGVVANGYGLIGKNPGANNNLMLVTGAGSLWTNDVHLTIGNDGAFNQLVVSNGGLVRNLVATVGSSSSANSNSVLVTGAGSLWGNRDSLLIGNNGTDNRLVISDGGMVANSSAGVGNNSGRSGNFVFITGAGSLWTNSAGMTLGSAGSFNQLVVSNGGAMRARGLVTVGGPPIATNNSVLAVGGSLASVGLTLGRTVSRNNSIMLSSNSTWNVGSGIFTWGNAGANDTLVIDATSGLRDIGGLTLDENNTAFFLTNAPGGYSLNGWTTNQFQLNPAGPEAVVVGHSGNNVQLTISDSKLANTTGTIGKNPGANNNSVFVAGAGSLWTNSDSLKIGDDGAFNQLVVSNGGLVRNTFARIGSSANSNLVVVTGAGSLWSSREDLLIGNLGTFNRLVISEGGVVANTSVGVGNNSGVGGNVVFVTGAGSRWNNSSSLTLGSSGSFNQLVVSNGAVVGNTTGRLGSGTAANSNLALITGAGSLWTNSGDLLIGNFAALNQLVVSNGAVVGNNIGYVGFNPSSSNNEAVVTGPGSLWNNRSELYVGNLGLGNRLMIADGGTVVASNAVYLGFDPISINNLLTVGGGGLIVTNPAGSGVLDLRRGTSVLNSGTIISDRVLLTNSQGFFTFNGGTLKTRGTTLNNGQLFTAGNGTSAAAFELAGNGLHTFSSGLAIANNAALRGNGTISGLLTVALGGTLSPGTSIGKIVLNTPPAMLGNVFMEISKSGASLTNDQVQVAGALAYGGSLTVSNLGPDTLALGNSFALFSATSYSGALSAIALPTLSAGLTWTNKLLVNGSIAVVTKNAPGISGVTQNGTKLVFNVTGGSPGGAWNLLTSTNVALPLLNWTTNSSGLFDWLGNVTLTNGINLIEPQRFYRMRVP